MKKREKGVYGTRGMGHEEEDDEATKGAQMKTAMDATKPTTIVEGIDGANNRGLDNLQLSVSMMGPRTPIDGGAPSGPKKKKKKKKKKTKKKQVARSSSRQVHESRFQLRDALGQGLLFRVRGWGLRVGEPARMPGLEVLNHLLAMRLSRREQLDHRKDQWRDQELNKANLGNVSVHLVAVV
eukprot:CAMPEP_0194782738 /NCGR_PEP_ID=MMETSP0323_2-20130528/78851_1 /TAXON_ID=2866 ORGANISM="Crypthecodinium cohnii, Strain Seligo" /NCGR_SAMPLE_ID=MMETSP0323_2 /ASSEMBLY_ACC=CAM_ASM_000346 /LENGTH=181 /DNA_ID=CAMNT_0039721573 /DNA_START=59 /DNA_END=606 /DNA_ORIENTATION=+